MATHENFKSVEEYVKFCGGTRPISKVLIANNGNAAIKAIRSIRRWAYEMFGNERSILFVVMATPEDLRANAEYIRMADEIVDVPGGSNNNNYANVNLIVEIAERWNVDAVWAGWGHASEKDLLPDTLEKTERKIVFIGPSGAPMRALGDKIGSTIIAQSAGVSCIGWNGDHLRVDYKKEGRIPDEIYDQANIKTVEQCVETCKRVGFPIMIKASEGGGGKGVRKVTCEDEVADAYRQVAGEVPGSPIFAMKLANKARHLEVQLLADAYGQAIALNGRDCSVQRRFQKIIEEGPPVAAKPEVWPQMEKAAVALALEVGYCNVGTVEYLYMYEEDTFAFLELNPRLQVEHPVTEMITNANIPACQLQVAMGIPLHRMPDVRRLYNRLPFDSDPIDFMNEERVPPSTHCIAVRITAENPDLGFQPTSGTIQELNFRSTPDVWGYFSVDSSGLVHEFADSQFGHLFAGGKNREAARKNMIMALKELSIRGDIRTTTEYIINMMQSEDFIQNHINTAWLDARLKLGPAPEPEEERLDPLRVVVIGALVTFIQRLSKLYDEFLEMISKGQYPSQDMLIVEDSVMLIYNEIKYVLKCAKSGQNSYTVNCNGSYVEADVRTLADGGFLLNLGGKSHNAYCVDEPTGLRMTLNGKTCIFSKEYDPTRLCTDVAGKLARQLMPEGAHLEANQPFAEVEVMKMYMPVCTGEAGVLHWKLTEGAAMQPGDCLATMDLDHPELVKTATPFTGTLTEESFPSTSVSSERPHIKLRQAVNKLNMVMQGFAVPLDQYALALDDLGQALQDPMLPLYEFEEALSVLTGRIDGKLFNQLKDLSTTYREKMQGGAPKEDFPILEVLKILEAHGKGLAERDRSAFSTLVAALKGVAEQYASGIGGRSVDALLSLIHSYLDVERNFHSLQYNDAVYQLRREHSADVSVVLDTCQSHASLSRKNKLLLSLLEQVRAASARQSHPKALKDIAKPSLTRSPNSLTSLLLECGNVDMQAFNPALTELGTFTQSAYGFVSLEARKLLIEQNLPSVEGRRKKLEDALNSIVAISPVAGFAQRSQQIQDFLRSNVPIRDVLPEFLVNGNEAVQLAALELYTRKIYQTHNIEELSGGTVDDMHFLKFVFCNMVTEVLPGLGVIKQNFSTANLSTLSSSASDDGHNSDTEGMATSTVVPASIPRQGAFFACPHWGKVEKSFTHMLEQFTAGEEDEPVHCLHIAVLNQPESPDEEAFVAKAQELVNKHAAQLDKAKLRRVTFMAYLNTSTYIPSVFTFRASKNFSEDILFRNIEPSYAFQLDLLRLSNFHIQLSESLQTQGGNVHVYSATPKRSLATELGLKQPFHERFFVRSVALTSKFVPNEVESIFVESLNALELKLAEFEDSYSSKGKKAPRLSSNHIFLNIVAPNNVVEPNVIAQTVESIMDKYKDKLYRLGVAHFEFKIAIRESPDRAYIPIRVLASNPTGLVLHLETYTEVPSPDSRGNLFKTIDGKPGIWDGKLTTTPYELIRPFERQRQAALASSDTLYCYDYLELFHQAVALAWKEKEMTLKHRSDMEVVRPAKLVESVELVVARKADAPGTGAWSLAEAEAGMCELVETSRPAGQNDVGMVAWLVTMRTPEYPDGRQIILISNDITFIQGSFGTREDWVFRAASEYARHHKLPRLYLAANSGARIGMANTLKKAFKVQWNNDEDPTQGFKYLYLTPEDNTNFVSKGAVKTKRVFDSDEERWMVTDIIGEEPDLGVENLRGSGMIAGETSMAYKDIFTLTLVTGRSVGIGAYLVRLGQRTIQKAVNAPIILTGYQALNKLMGKEIYTTNDQLGGGSLIMYPNGVSHLLVDDHLDGVVAAVKWLSYVPAIRGMPLPITDITGVDMVERSVQWYPKKGEAYDPRHLVCGQTELDGQWVSGFFDQGSFTETLAGWAKTVIVGRARLGGIPMGVIVTENRTVECVTPADPANPISVEETSMQAGGVWFPDSAYKTAQAINDFNAEDLPLIIFANWRGFSGGQRDMFNEVLKFGAQIVDALVAFQQPIFVYMPPFAELRGGAWVVVDSTINPNVMEFFAAEDSRGGVLEATGAASIKYRAKDMLATAHRLDPKLQQMDARLNADGLSDDERTKLQAEIAEREKLLMGIYHQIAVQFADLHDTPGRMESTGVIVQEVQWPQSRSFFYWRLRRRLAEFQLRRQVVKHSPEPVTPNEASELIKGWFVASGREASEWNDSKLVLSWIAEKAYYLKERLDELRRRSVEAKARQMAMDSPEAAAKGLVAAFQQMDYMQREILRQQLQSIR